MRLFALLVPLALTLVVPGPTGQAIEAATAVATCQGATADAVNGTGVGNHGRLVLVLASRQGGTACTATIRVTNVTQVGEGRSIVRYSGVTSASCAPGPVVPCLASIDLGWSYCGDAKAIDWLYEVRIDQTVRAQGHVRALTAPQPCPPPEP